MTVLNVILYTISSSLADTLMCFDYFLACYCSKSMWLKAFYKHILVSPRARTLQDLLRLIVKSLQPFK